MKRFKRTLAAIPAGTAWSMKDSQTLPVDATLPQGRTFTIPSGAPLTNNGTLTLHGTLGSRAF